MILIEADLRKQIKQFLHLLLISLIATSILSFIFFSLESVLTFTQFIMMTRSCDTFVVLPPLTDSKFRIFGKNSDRPTKEVQEVIFVSKEHTSNNKDHVQVRIGCFSFSSNYLSFCI